MSSYYLKILKTKNKPKEMETVMETIKKFLLGTITETPENFGAWSGEEKKTQMLLKEHSLQ